MGQVSRERSWCDPHPGTSRAWVFSLLLCSVTLAHLPVQGWPGECEASEDALPTAHLWPDVKRRSASHPTSTWEGQKASHSGNRVKPDSCSQSLWEQRQSPGSVLSHETTLEEYLRSTLTVGDLK